MQFAVISYWCGEEGIPRVWLFTTQEEAEDALKNLYNQSVEAAREDEYFDEEDCFCDGTTAKVSWSDGLARWFEVSDVYKEIKI